MQGIVKWFDSKTRGYGFITPSEGEKDIFIHISSLQKSRLDTLREGQKVEFDISAGKKGPEAINVRVL